jgi:methionine synthase II (cobalamin-independent)
MPPGPHPTKANAWLDLEHGSLPRTEPVRRRRNEYSRQVYLRQVF